MSTRWDPFRDAMSLRDAMDRLLEQSVISPRGGHGPTRGATTLPLDLWETPDAVIARVPLPGIRPDDESIDVSVDGNVLTIRARMPGISGDDGEAPDQGMRWIHREVPRGEVRRAVELPIAVDADRATAQFTHGLLQLTLPKLQPARPRKINVTPG